MFISNIIGGLGNQMFQYAICRALSIQKGLDFRLDIQGYQNYQLHNGYELNRVFGISDKLSTAKELRKVLGWQSQSLARKLLLKNRFSKFRGSNYIVEPQVNYWSGINEISNNAYLVGYWMSEKYFLGAAQQIRQDFAFNHPMSSENSIIASKILNSNAVSLHVRRGDIASNPATLAIHGLCGLEYYKKAIEEIASRVDKPHFYIFSDDMLWTKQHLAINYPCEYIEHNQGKESFNDMRLMSLCKHNIIANSTFSWWGAWLNNSKNKLVIAPTRWFSADINASDIVPSSWLRI